MSENSLWEFHQREVERLNSARQHACFLGIPLKALFQSVQTDDPDDAEDLFDASFLGKNEDYDNLTRCMSEIGHLITSVAKPYDVPLAAPWEGYRRSDSAHDGIMKMYRSFRLYLNGQALLGGIFDSKTCSASDLIDHKWADIREKLLPVCDFDVSALLVAIVAESTAAIERSRISAIAALSGRELQPAANLRNGDLTKAQSAEGAREKAEAFQMVRPASTPRSLEKSKRRAERGEGRTKLICNCLPPRG